MDLTHWSRQKMFQFIHGNNLVYNQCWEDPRLDRVALEIKPTDRIVMLTSAGCNALNYLLDKPASIDTVDVNPRQNALLELKISTIKNLDYQDFFQLFGTGAHPQAQTLYRQALRHSLSSEAQGFWDRHMDLFVPKNWSPSFYFRGSAGWVARLLRHYINWKGLGPHMQKAFATSNLTTQRNIYWLQLKPHFWNDFLRWLTRRALPLSALGVPRSQFLQIEKVYEGGMAQFIEKSLDAVFTQIPLKDNYFYRLYLFGSYSQECAPDYLLEENFETLKSRVHCIRTHTQSLLEFLQESSDPIDKVSLLDHMDWLYEHHRDQLYAQWQLLFSRLHRGARVIWRSASPEPDFIDPIPIGKGTSLRDCLHYHVDLAQRLHPLDRVHTYASFSIAEAKL